MEELRKLFQKKSLKNFRRDFKKEFLMNSLEKILQKMRTMVLVEALNNILINF